MPVTYKNNTKSWMSAKKFETNMTAQNWYKIIVYTDCIVFCEIFVDCFFVCKIFGFCFLYELYCYIIFNTAYRISDKVFNSNEPAKSRGNTELFHVTFSIYFRK